MHEDHEKWIKIEDVHTVMVSMPAYKKILFSDGKTKLLDCITSMEKPSTLQIFLLNIVDINAVLPSDSSLWPGCTPLHLAVMFSRNMKKENKPANLIKQLLDKGASVHVQDQLGTTPLHLAFRLELQQIVALLLRCLEKNAKEVTNLLDSENLSYLHIFCTTSDHRNGLARKLLSDKHKIESTVNVAYKGKALTNVKPGWTPLHVAAHQSQLYLVELLLQQGADLLCTDAQENTAIHPLFGNAGAKPLADLLFASEQLEECVVEDNGLTHLHVAVWFDDVETVERLLDLGANIEATVKSLEGEDLEKFVGCSPLRIAMLLDHYKTVRVLLQRGADVLARKHDGTSPLSHALVERCRTDREEIRKAFLASIWSDAKLQQRLREELGLTMLHAACYSADYHQVEQELKKGADVNARVHDCSNFWMGYTPLYVLIASSKLWYYGRSEEMDVLRILLEYNCDVDQQESAAGKTALHLAIELKEFRYVEVLFAAGPDVNVVDRTGKSVLSYALELCTLCEYQYEINYANRLIIDLILHLYEMQLVGIEVSEFNETLRDDEFPKYTVEWDESEFFDRVQATEKIEIGKRGLTVRSFLSETHAISMYPSLTPENRADVAAFIQSFNDQDLLDVIPLLRLQYRKAVARLSLIDPARDSLKTFISSSFPDLCVDMILKYLSNSQMKQLIAAASVDDSNP